MGQHESFLEQVQCFALSYASVISALIESMEPREENQRLIEEFEKLHQEVQGWQTSPNQAHFKIPLERQITFNHARNVMLTLMFKEGVLPQAGVIDLIRKANVELLVLELRCKELRG